MNVLNCAKARIVTRCFRPTYCPEFLREDQVPKSDRRTRPTRVSLFIHRAHSTGKVTNFFAANRHNLQKQVDEHALSSGTTSTESLQDLLSRFRIAFRIVTI
jgi:hypothetical protein